MWGVATTLSSLSRGLSVGVGSCSKTSRPAPAIQPSVSARTSGRLVDHRPARGVDQHGLRFHHAQLAFADQVTSLLQEGAV